MTKVKECICDSYHQALLEEGAYADDLKKKLKAARQEIDRLKSVLTKVYVEARIYNGTPEFDKIASMIESAVERKTS